MDSVLQQMSDFTRLLNFAKKQAIYTRGTSSRGFYYLKSGQIGIYQTTESGKESLLRVYGTGSFFGYRSLFTEKVYHATARAMLPSEVLHIKIDTFSELESISSRLSDFLMRGVCYELGEAENRLTELTSNSAKLRILDTINYLFTNHSDYPWTYREVGEFSGTDTTTVIRFCKQLKQREILSPSSRSLVVNSFEGLKTYRRTLSGL